MTVIQSGDAGPATGKLRVLVVDDDRDQAEGLADLLEPRGYQVAMALGADETRQRLAEFDAQVALIDVRLGGECGIDLVRELAQFYPGVLCVMITAYADLDNAIESFQEGVFDFLRKPFEPAALFMSLDRCAERIRLQREKAEVEEALRESERRFRTSLMESPFPAMLHAEDGEVVALNVVWTELTDYAHEEIPTVSAWTERAYGEKMDVVKSDIDRLFGLNSRVHEGEYCITARDGSILTWDFSSSPLGKLPDGRRVVLSMAIDVTDRKRAEAEREDLIAKLETQNAELERFAYTVSHDLKSPLITINGFVGMLSEDLAEGDSDAVKDDLARISDAADKMDRLLTEVLHLSRIGRMVKPSEDVPLEELAREALELVSGQARQSGVQVEISPDLPVVFGDRIRLLEVLQNLIDNAVKYMGDPSRPRITIGSRRDGAEAICYVRDNGIGIEPRYHEKVFGLFDQLDPAVEGSGVGLALVKRIVEMHGGRIWVESEGPRQGSTFCFTIPARTESRELAPCESVDHGRR